MWPAGPQLIDPLNPPYGPVTPRSSNFTGRREKEKTQELATQKENQRRTKEGEGRERSGHRKNEEASAYIPS